MNSNAVDDKQIIVRNINAVDDEQIIVKNINAVDDKQIIVKNINAVTRSYHYELTLTSSSLKEMAIASCNSSSSCAFTSSALKVGLV